MNETFWLRRARREALRFNVGWSVQRFIPWVVGGGLFAAIALIYLRSQELSIQPVWALGAVLFLVGLGASVLAARRAFLSTDDALARLDADLRLQNALTSARAEVISWPDAREDARLALRWNWPRILLPAAAAFLLIAAGVLVPIPQGNAATARAMAEPSTWAAVQQRLDELKKKELVQPEAVEQFQSELDALRKQKADKWFSHESLEAGDQLQTQTAQGLAALQKQLETAMSTYDASRKLEETQLQAVQQTLGKQLQEALQGMQAGAMPLNTDLLKTLEGIDLSKVRQMTPEQWGEIRKRMKEGIKTASGGQSDGEEVSLIYLSAMRQNNGGGVPSRGPGAAPLTLKDETKLGTKTTEATSNPDLSHAVAGDVTGLSSRDHKVDKLAYTGPQAGGGMAEVGPGGEAAWEQTANPAEQQALKSFFRQDAAGN
jgi:hypothetical protein